MPQNCAVPFCTERKGGHKFPRDKTVANQWLVAIRRDNYIPSKHSRVCKKHFNPDDYELPKESYTENPIPKLKPNVVPSRFSWNHESEERKEIKRKRGARARQRQEKHETATLCSNTEENQCEEPTEETCEEKGPENSNKDVSVQCSLCRCDDSLTNIANLSEHESYRKSTLNMFRIVNLKDKPDIVQFYTGFDSYNHFMFVFNLFGDEVYNLKYYQSLQLARGRHALTPSDQFYLTLIKLRRNMCNKELSFHFEISDTTVSNYLITWINYLYCKFKDLNVGLPKKTIDGTKTNTCTVIKIIDCAETKVEKPQHPDSPAAYSNYKSSNALKVLVGISGSGCVTFVSDAYEGSVSDRELFEKCGMINLLLKGDIIPGDPGFNIRDQVNMPQFLKKGGNLLEAHQLRKSKKLSSINVERVTGLGKTFKILSNELSSDLVSLGGSIIFVCFMLANFKKNTM